VDSSGRTIFVADAHRDDGRRSIVRADEKLTAFLELESTVEPLRVKSKKQLIAPGEGLAASFYWPFGVGMAAEVVRFCCKSHW